MTKSDQHVTRYAFLWHVLVSDEAAAALCESAQIHVPTEREARRTLEAWLEERQISCTEPNCECKKGGLIANELSPKMIMGGMTQHMVTL